MADPHLAARHGRDGEPTTHDGRQMIVHRSLSDSFLAKPAAYRPPL
jgi:hypothetical protein